jgi:heme/copper-type cytochrome/quinol oxidase subunit 3
MSAYANQAARGAAGDHRAPAPQRAALAPTSAAAGRIARRRSAQPNGIWGMALFLGAETMLFAGLIASYFYLDFRATRWPPAGAQAPETLYPSLLTGVLVATSIPVALAARRAIAGRRAPAMGFLAVAAFMQSGYLAYQLHDLVAQVHSLPPQSSSYASAYIALLGLHHAHVLLGVLLDLGMLFWLSVSGLSDYRITGVRCVALYWHVVNAIAVAVLLTELSPVL